MHESDRYDDNAIFKTFTNATQLRPKFVILYFDPSLRALIGGQLGELSIPPWAIPRRMLQESLAGRPSEPVDRNPT